MLNKILNNTVTLNKQQYYESLEERFKTGKKLGFEDGYKAGYRDGTINLPMELRKHIHLLVEVLEKMLCEIEVNEDSFENMLIGTETYVGKHDTYPIQMKETMIRITPMGYVTTNVGSVIDDIKSIIREVKGK